MQEISAPDGGTPAPAAPSAVATKVLEIVADTTGYPPEMLELDLDLEADLGVDTVKQAETFAAVREVYDIPRDDALQLRDFPTLADVIRFVYERRPDLAPASAGTTTTSNAPSSPQPAASAPQEQNVEAATATTNAKATTLMRGDMNAADGIPRRIVAPVLRPSIGRCKTTEISLGAGDRVLVVTDNGGVGKALIKRLEKRGVEVLPLAPRKDAGWSDLEDALQSFVQAGPVRGLYWLPALDGVGALKTLTPADASAALTLRAKLFFYTLRALYAALGANCFVLSATRLGGAHGYDPAGALCPFGGATVGVTKTFKRERPEVLVKAVDFPSSRKTSALADALIEETLWDPGAVEIGRPDDATRLTIALREEARPPSENATLAADQVYAVTGAAGSIVSAIVADIASAAPATFHLMDIAPEPRREDPDLQLFATDREQLKRVLFERLKSEGQRPTPVMIEKRLAGIERAHAAAEAMQAVRAAGGTVIYHSGDLMDSAWVQSVADRIRGEHGRVDVLIHAAGLEISRMMPDKTHDEFDRVFDVKAQGYLNLLAAIDDMPLGTSICFSSIAGRFGNAGQADYSAANDFLCKMTSSMRSQRPQTRAVAIDWTAWGDIGMATRGSIPKMMEKAGIEMLPAAAGIPIVRRELMAETNEEILIAQALGVLQAPWDADGGLAPQDSAGQSESRGPMSAETGPWSIQEGLSLITHLDPREQPFLCDHRIDDTAVLPGVMGLEAFAEAALEALPNHRLQAISNVQFLAPFKFYRQQPRAVTTHAQADCILPATGRVQCTVSGSRTLANQSTPQVTTHFMGTVQLAPQKQERQSDTPLAPMPIPNLAKSERGIQAEHIYRVFFHGPAYRVLEAVWREGERTIGLMTAGLPDNHSPRTLPLLAAPRHVELCFQTAGAWQIGTTGALGLPRALERLTFVKDLSECKTRLLAVVQPRGDDRFDASVIDERGDIYLQINGYQTIPLPGIKEAELLAPFRRALAD